MFIFVSYNNFFSQMFDAPKCQQHARTRLEYVRSIETFEGFAENSAFEINLYDTYRKWLLLTIWIEIFSRASIRSHTPCMTGLKYKVQLNCVACDPVLLSKLKQKMFQKNAIILIRRNKFFNYFNKRNLIRDPFGNEFGEGKKRSIRMWNIHHVKWDGVVNKMDISLRNDVKLFMIITLW